MFGLALRRTARVDPGYVCLPCLFRQLSLPIWHHIRQYTTTIQGTETGPKGEIVTDIDLKGPAPVEKTSPTTKIAASKARKRRRRRLRKALSTEGAKTPSASKDNDGSVNITKHKVQRNLVRKFESEGKTPKALSAQQAEGSSKKLARESAIQKHLKNAKGGKRKDEVQIVHAAALNIQPVEVDQRPVPTLSYGLERVLFNPGVYHLQDPRSRVYNFDPYLQTIMPVAEFDFHALKQYVTSSKDESLQKIAQKEGKKYVGSTSSMTGVLAHFHFLLSQWRAINTSTLSQGFPDKLRSFTQMQRCPSAIFLRKKSECYAIDVDKEYDSANILSMLGKSMEKLLTLSTEDYERYRKSNKGAVSEDERNTPEAFHYSTMGDFLLRSQLDAHDARLPGTGMFDLKTRAIVSIRMDTKNYEKGKDYEIRSRQGEWESFEREYFDMIRSAFLKYSLQVRMGRMDGIFVAFHNTERIFGFQYISLPEMDSTLHGQWETSLGDQEFKLSLELLNKCLDRASQKFPDQSLRIHFETRDTRTPFMYIFAEPVTEEQVQDIQMTKQESIADFERRVLGLHNHENGNETSPADEESASREWADLQAKVAQEMENDEMTPENTKAGRDVDAGTVDGSTGDGRSTPEASKHEDVVSNEGSASETEVPKQRLVSAIENRHNLIDNGPPNADSVSHELEAKTTIIPSVSTEESEEQYGKEPDSKTDTVSEPCGVTRAQETDGANIAEMQETLL
ncbi:MAG: hypothetical protein M1835_003204, partial [Candelina submexicana]